MQISEVPKNVCTVLHVLMEAHVCAVRISQEECIFKCKYRVRSSSCNVGKLKSSL